MTMKTILTILALSLASCAPKSVFPLPPPVVKQPPIIQPIQLVAASNQATEKVVSKLQVQVNTLQTAGKILSDAMAKGEDQADALQKAIDAKSSAELLAQSNAQLWQDAAKKTTDLIADNVALRATVDELKEAQANTDVSITTLSEAGKDKDAEVAKIQLNDAIIRKGYSDKAAEAAASAKEVAKMEPIYHAWLWIKWGAIGLAATWLITAAFVFFGKLTLPPPLNILFKFL